jgi:hypothetical protein
MKRSVLPILILSLSALGYQACDSGKGTERINSNVLEDDPKAVGDGLKGSGKGELPADKDADFITALQGTWETKCVSTNPGPGSMINKAIFQDKQYTHETTFYLDNESSEPSRFIQTKSSYLLKEKIPQPSFPDTYEFDQLHITGSITPKTQDLADYYNSNKFLDYSDWKLNEAKEYSGRRQTPTSEPEPAAGDPTYQLLGVRDGYLVFGQPIEGTFKSDTPASRPKTLSEHLVYTKK